MLWQCIKEHQNKIFFYIKVTANSSNNQFLGEFITTAKDSPYRLKIAIAEEPTNGKANKELISFLSKTLKEPKNNFIITKGQTSSLKTVILHPSPNNSLNAIITIIKSHTKIKIL